MGGGSSETASTMRWPNFFHIHVVKLRGGLQNENLCSSIVVFFPIQVEIKPIQVRQEAFFIVNIIVPVDVFSMVFYLKSEYDNPLSLWKLYASSAFKKQKPSICNVIIKMDSEL